MYLPDIPTDQELLLRLRSGDMTAFEALYDRHWHKVYTQAFKGLKDPDVAKDITQEVFVYLWSNQQRLQIQNMSAYLYSSVRHNVFRHLKRQQLFLPLPQLLENVEAHASAADAKLIHDELLQAHDALVDTLPPAQQTIFKLRYEEDLTTAEIASRLSISRKTVQNQLTRAVAMLRASLLTLCFLLSFINK